MGKGKGGIFPGSVGTQYPACIEIVPLSVYKILFYQQKSTEHEGYAVSLHALYFSARFDENYVKALAAA